METSALWSEAYEGEVFGEALFAGMAERQTDDARRADLELLARLERETRLLAEPILDRHGIERADLDAARSNLAGTVETVAAMPWDEFLASIEPVADKYLQTYRRLAETVTDDDERRIAEAYVAHELALVSFARRARGVEAGDPGEAIRALPHVGGTDQPAPPPDQPVSASTRSGR